ncbi:lipocalin family protein [Niabella sp. CC-SYL272]|uniref:lipocalin family protein n=1 Tax=Niabella agricola TaxID=2891571 RepID=UPI001F24A367|nr:lipocalin family protein [Niabella agricola]MCF3108270.1 lipocalin family protein [Niabella agricola]
MQKKQWMKGLVLAALGAAIAAVIKRRTIPKGVKAVAGFEKDRYLGRWFEIARFDFYFEKHLSLVTATYTSRDDGTIEVVNRGFDYYKSKWQQSTGRAKFTGDEHTGSLVVSFFGPFYAGYNVIAIDPGYQYALVCGKSRKYLWLLSRQKTMPAAVKEHYLHIARDFGFPVSRLTWTQQD